MVLSGNKIIASMSPRRHCLAGLHTQNQGNHADRFQIELAVVGRFRVVMRKDGEA